MDEPDAVIREVNGQLVLDDPTALGVVRAVEAHNYGMAKANCKVVFDAMAGRVTHFAKRIVERRLSPNDVVIVCVNADDIHGQHVAEALMPGHDWAPFRARGEVPYARGLAGREGVQGIQDALDTPAAEKLREMAGKVAVVVIDHTVAEVFSPYP